MVTWILMTMVALIPVSVMIGAYVGNRIPFSWLDKKTQYMIERNQK